LICYREGKNILKGSKPAKPQNGWAMKLKYKINSLIHCPAIWHSLRVLIHPAKNRLLLLCIMVSFVYYHPQQKRRFLAGELKVYHSLILKYNLYVTLLRKECTQLPMESKTGIKIHKGLSIQFYFPSVIVSGFAGFVVNKGYSHSGIFFAFAKINARVESSSLLY